MVRFAKSSLVAVVALGLFAGPACKKSDDANHAGGGDDLSLIPADSEMVIGLNFAQLQQSALWKQYAPKIMDKMSGKLSEFKAACGFDPMDAFKSMSMGMKNLSGSGKPEGVIVVHGPEKSKLMACMDKYKGEAAKNGTDVSVDGDVILVKDKNGDTSAMTFVNDTTIIGVVGPNATKDGVKAAAKGGSTLKTSQTFVDMYSKINTQDSLWVLVNGNSGLLDKASSVGIKPKAVFGSLNVTDGLAVDVRIRLASADDAKSFVGMMKGQTDNPQVKAMFDKLDVTNDGADARVTVAMSNQKLQALVGMVGGMMGGLMGGGGHADDPTPPSP
jgi:hypothetical protein